jgi:hypothetical protein
MYVTVSIGGLYGNVLTYEFTATDPKRSLGEEGYEGPVAKITLMARRPAGITLDIWMDELFKIEEASDQAAARSSAWRGNHPKAARAALYWALLDYRKRFNLDWNAPISLEACSECKYHRTPQGPAEMVAGQTKLVENYRGLGFRPVGGNTMESTLAVVLNHLRPSLFKRSQTQVFQQEEGVDSFPAWNERGELLDDQFHWWRGGDTTLQAFGAPSVFG